MRRLGLMMLLLAITCGAASAQETTATMINAFNQTPWLANPTATALDNGCTVSLTTCNAPTDTFGQILNTRAPREIQLGFKFYW